MGSLAPVPSDKALIPVTSYDSPWRGLGGTGILVNSFMSRTLDGERESKAEHTLGVGLGQRHISQQLEQHPGALMLIKIYMCYGTISRWPFTLENSMGLPTESEGQQTLQLYSTSKSQQHLPLKENSRGWRGGLVLQRLAALTRDQGSVLNTHCQLTTSVTPVQGIRSLLTAIGTAHTWCVPLQIYGKTLIPINVRAGRGRWWSTCL